MITSRLVGMFPLTRLENNVLFIVLVLIERKYLNWIEKYHRALPDAVDGTFVDLFLERLEEEAAKANASLELAMKEKLARKRKQTHSVLENVAALESTL